MPTFFLIGFAVVIVVLLWVILNYNSFVVLKNRAKEAWSDIDVQLKRRYDLIPNLVETVRGYATHEKELLEKVTQARAMAMNTQGMSAKADAENMLSDTLKSLFAISENYPDLKASQNFLALQGELADTENKIQAARRFYNANVRDLNIKIESFPDNFLAKIFNFKQMELFQVESEVERKPVNVTF